MNIRQRLLNWILGGVSIDFPAHFGRNSVVVSGAANTITMAEQATPADPSAGDGLIYIKNDAPSTMHYIDDDSGDLDVARATEYTVHTRSTNQSSNLNAGDQVEFNLDKGSVIIANATGVFTLTAGKTYFLLGNVNCFFSGNTGDLVLQWYDIGNAQFIGSANHSVCLSRTANVSGSETAMALFTAAPGANTVELRIVSETALTTLESGNYGKCLGLIMELY